MKALNKKQFKNMCLLFLVIVQFMAICYINFTKSYHFLDLDSSLAIRHAIEIWKHGLFIPDFNYFSTLETDCASFFAAPLYLLTHNLNFALGITHIAIYACFIFILHDIIKNIGAGIDSFFLAILVIFSPFSFGQLDWTNMIYISAGQYGFRILTTLLILDLMLLCESSLPYHKKKKLFFIFIACLSIVFWTSLSSGNYILFMVIFPIILKIALDIILKQKLSLRDYRIYIITFIAISAIAGWYLHKYYAGTPMKNSLNLKPANELLSNIINCITGIFLLLGGLTQFDNISVFSRFGISTLIRLVFACISLSLFIYYVFHITKLKKGFKNLIAYSAMIAFVNISVLMLTNTTYGSAIFEYRYHIIWCLPILLCTAILVSSKVYPVCYNTWIKNLVLVGSVMCLLIINITGFNQIYHYKDMPTREINIINSAKDLSVDTIYIQGPNAEKIRVLDPELYCASVGINEQGGIKIDTGDFYQFYGDNAAAANKNILISTQENFDKLPVYLRSPYQLINELDNEECIYYSSVNPWDGISGLPFRGSKTSVDFPYSPGYTYSGELMPDGTLITDGSEGIVFKGPNKQSVAGSYKITLYYEILENPVGLPYIDFLIDNGTTILDRHALEDKKDFIVIDSLDIPANTKFEFNIWTPIGTKIKVKKICFECTDK